MMFALMTHPFASSPIHPEIYVLIHLGKGKLHILDKFGGLFEYNKSISNSWLNQQAKLCLLWESAASV